MDCHAGAHSLPHRDGALDAERVHDGQTAGDIVGEAGLTLDWVGVSMARIVHRHDTELGREGGYQFGHQRGGLLVDVQQHDGRARARLAVVEVSEGGAHQAATDVRSHDLESIR